MKVDHISMSTTPVWLFNGNTEVSQGSGFYYTLKTAEDQYVFLITNHHVLTGSAPLENKPPLGNRIIFQFHQSGDDTGKVKTVEMPLFTNSGKPTWFGSTAFPEADVAVVPVVATLLHECHLYVISREIAKPKMKVRPTTPVTLIGYPYGFYDTKNALPIWKTGTVASEPDVDFDGKPLMMIDVAAFPGMSGSPAFAIAIGTYELHEGNGIATGSVRQFMGIYASMQMLNKHKFLELLPHALSPGIRDQESLQIGHIWKAQLILDIVDGIDIERYQREVLSDILPPNPVP